MNNILIIDDEKDFCIGLKQCLESLGIYKVSYRTEPERVEYSLEYEDADVILVDLRMDDRSGEELILSLRGNDEKPVKRFIAVSGITAVETQIPINPPVPLLPKPVNISRLHELIQETLTQPSVA
ncbi:MAG: response regulator [Verrucomicrobiota bacterium JB023]|nr:response regulator [Verrucomicrobiota bacterium JB023]